MNILKGIGDLIGSGVGALVKDVGETVNGFVHTGEEKAEWDLKQKELELKVKQIALEAEGLILSDRQSARAMYKHDSTLQKIVASVFTVAYFVITALLVYLAFSWVKGTELDVPTWAVSLVSGAFGALSAKVNTIIDFLFGGSQGERDNVGAISRSFEEGAAARRQNGGG